MPFISAFGLFAKKINYLYRALPLYEKLKFI